MTFESPGGDHTKRMKKSNIPIEQLTRLRRIRGLARLMDTALRIPGTRMSLGADSVLGLIPGVGDFAAAAVSLIIVNEARVSACRTTSS